MSYYENRINALEARIEEMAMLNRMKTVSVEPKLMIRIKELNDENARLKADIQRLTEFTTRTIIPNGILQSEVNQLKIELADAQESYHIINEIIASERNVHRTNTAMLKDQIDGLYIDNRLLGERVLAYQKLKQLNDIPRPPDEA